MNNDVNNSNSFNNQPLNNGVNNNGFNNQPLNNGANNNGFNNQPLNNGVNNNGFNNQPLNNGVNNNGFNNQPLNNGVNNNGFNNQPLNNTKKQNKNSKSIIFIVGIVLVLLLIGTILFFVKNKGGDGLKIGNSPEKIAKNYLTYLKNEKFDDAYKLVYLPENSFVTNSDYIKFISRKEYISELKEYKIDSTTNLIADEEATIKVKIEEEEPKEETAKSKTISIKLKKNFDKKWKVVEDNIYVENWSILIPKNSNFYIDNELLDKKLISEKAIGTYGFYDKYVIPAIYPDKKKFKIETQIETKEFEMTPLNSNTNKKMTVELKNEEIIQGAFDFIKNTWNDMYINYINGTDVSEMQKYFSDKNDLEAINTYYKKGFDALTSGSSGYKYINYQMQNVTNGKKSVHYSTFEDIITINFLYKLTWNWEFSLNNGIRTMERYAKVRLQYKDGQYKIYDVVTDDLFSYSNEYTKEK